MSQDPIWSVGTHHNSALAEKALERLLEKRMVAIGWADRKVPAKALRSADAARAWVDSWRDGSRDTCAGAFEGLLCALRPGQRVVARYGPEIRAIGVLREPTPVEARRETTRGAALLESGLLYRRDDEDEIGYPHLVGFVDWVKLRRPRHFRGLPPRGATLHKVGDARVPIERLFESESVAGSAGDTGDSDPTQRGRRISLGLKLSDEQRQNGAAGQEYALTRERRRIRHEFGRDVARKVQPAWTNNSFDITSVYDGAAIKIIEVKTTVTDTFAFLLSGPELVEAMRYGNRYSVYRVLRFGLSDQRIEEPVDLQTALIRRDVVLSHVPFGLLVETAHRSVWVPLT